ncbi:putative zinc metalloprotease Rip3 [Novipirellula aureliae]|uniref:Zinc metalloprotease n=1 Tax=Novipirellula aureliae TaxID=2527966 RepID=A0A5C6DK49_9BACT|nr:site-2 protease family protein [Novipirellula aureliae]TWU35306.1 putative zinc metalloprotease Rip3 [Novipirellula aureliae]
MFERRIKLGKFLGIGVYVHWTFALLVAYVAFSAKEDGLGGILFGISLLFGVFLCVTLHEYGHALAARRFGIPTLDITLLPIGGVARLERMPRIAWQELVVAVAGPAVNVVIGSLLLVGIYLFGAGGYLVSLLGLPTDEATFNEANRLFGAPSIFGFTLQMLGVNIMLVLFNLVPAFPMDGGRVLRSLLAMVTTYRTATFVASRIGLGCAVLMATFAIFSGAYMLLFIAMFIAYAGLAEARQVDLMESVEGLLVEDCMIQYPTSIPMDMTLSELAGRWQTAMCSSLPVVAPSGVVVGVVKLKEIISAIDSGVAPSTTAGQLANHDVPVARIDSELKQVITGQTGRDRQIPVVDQGGRLIGMLDLDSVLLRATIAKHLAQSTYSPDRFDAIT